MLVVARPHACHTSGAKRTPRTTSPPPFFIKGKWVHKYLYLVCGTYVRVLYPLSLAMYAVCVLAKIALFWSLWDPLNSSKGGHGLHVHFANQGGC